MITEDTNIIDAVQNHPEILGVFAEYGLGCVGCMASHFETIGQGAGAHGLDVDALIEDINKVIAASENVVFFWFNMNFSFHINKIWCWVFNSIS